MGVAQSLQFKWDANAVELLKQLCADPSKPSASQIAARMKLPRNAIIGKANRLGIALPGKGKRGVRMARIRKIMRTAGLSVDPIPPAKTVKRQRLTNRGTRFAMETITEYEQPVMAAVDIEPLNIPLLDLEPHHCRWPLGDGPFVFCGHLQYPGSSYCPAHFELSCGPGSYAERQAFPAKRKAA